MQRGSRIKMNILGIETSCDESAAAIYNTDKGVLSSELYSQIEIQKEFGGVIPEVASRSHLDKIDAMVKKALEVAKISLQEIDAVAVTTKPGLPGSLLIGLNFAKSLAYSLKIPLIGVNHLDGHAFSSFLENTVPFPHVCLTASGGHTNIYLMEDFGKYQILGTTADDAAGECMDKVAKFMGYPYPGGPVIEKLAREEGFVDYYKFPRGKNQQDLRFSFSGLKTAVLYKLAEEEAFDLKTKKFIKPCDDALKRKVASSLLVCVKDIFIKKLKVALKLYPQIKSVSFVGGVACNKYLKEQLGNFCKERNIQFFSPTPKFCTDNAAMIAYVGHYKAQHKQFDNLTLDIF
jgi:N6-L-threonylcarbamoyladenine synthase